MIALSPTMEKGSIQRWNIKEGESFSSGDVLCDIETDKTTMEYEAPDDGTLLKIIVNEGGQAAVGETIGIFGDKDEDIGDLLQEIEDEADKPSESEESDSKEPGIIENDLDESPADLLFEKRVKISPLAKKIAKQKGIDIQSVQGSGPNGRIIKKDIENIRPQSAETKKANIIQPSGQDIILPLSDKRKIIAQRLADSKYTAPHYYLKLSVVMDDLLITRKQYNAQHPDEKLSLNAFLIKLAAEAIRHYPVINSSWADDKIIQHGSIDIGIAVAQDEGLITPIIRNAGNKGLRQIDQELSELISKPREGRLAPEEYQGATFTISNLGSYGIEEFTAIINPPGSAIMAVGSINKTPIVDSNDQITVKSLMKLTLSCDHRLIDGAKGAEFLKYLKDIIENPMLALL
jgi:pyruvate dehydrogenase E2 component (dihydrolipoamide acetyltransferase)